MGKVRSVIAHHDAARHDPGTFNTVIRDGHSKLAGPLSHYALRRDGTIHVVAAGRCWHAGANINPLIYGNKHAIGIEAGNDGVGEPWPRRQLEAYEALCARAGARVRQATEARPRTQGDRAGAEDRPPRDQHAHVPEPGR
ncbi:hypothetical protein BJF85_16780 [Saccharomonospora sp. CUA-673]|nr:hypothetical protein BJF85_16780 [Saccharomonospora sp. CUA-673]